MRWGWINISALGVLSLAFVTLSGSGSLAPASASLASSDGVGAAMGGGSGSSSGSGSGPSGLASSPASTRKSAAVPGDRAPIGQSPAGPISNATGGNATGDVGSVGAVPAVPATLAVPPTRKQTCTRLAFSVNDYGRKGPARDAKRLLDKHIALWTAKKGIKGYRTGPKKVTCKLFLDFKIFDEYTCRAEASVCW